MIGVGVLTGGVSTSTGCIEVFDLFELALIGIWGEGSVAMAAETEKNQRLIKPKSKL